MTMALKIRHSLASKLTKRVKPMCMATVLSVLAGVNGYAATILTANLTNSQEIPPVVPTLGTGSPRPASFGTATFELNDAQTALTFTATIFNIDVTGLQTADLSDDLTVGLLHASPVTPVLNAPAVWGFFGSPFNDNNPNDAVVTPFASGVGGVFSGKWDLPEGNGTTLAEQVANILSNRAYINFHTVQFGGGEIRGTLEVVPEPSTVVLSMVGALVMLGLRRRHQRTIHPASGGTFQQ
jgi:hypothetical protein